MPEQKKTSSHVITLYTDAERKNEAFPRTKVEAITNNEGNGLQALLNSKANSDDLKKELNTQNLRVGRSVHINKTENTGDYYITDGKVDENGIAHHYLSFFDSEYPEAIFNWDPQRDILNTKNLKVTNNIICPTIRHLRKPSEDLKIRCLNWNGSSYDKEDETFSCPSTRIEWAPELNTAGDAYDKAELKIQFKLAAKPKTGISYEWGIDKKQLDSEIKKIVNSYKLLLDSGRCLIGGKDIFESKSNGVLNFDEVKKSFLGDNVLLRPVWNSGSNIASDIVTDVANKIEIGNIIEVTFYVLLS